MRNADVRKTDRKPIDADVHSIIHSFADMSVQVGSYSVSSGITVQPKPLSALNSGFFHGIISNYKK